MEARVSKQSRYFSTALSLGSYEAYKTNHLTRICANAAANEKYYRNATIN